MMNDSDHKWIQRAVHHPGSFTRQAKAHHMGVQKYAQAHKHDKGVTGKRARLAITLNKLSK